MLGLCGLLLRFAGGPVPDRGLVGGRGTARLRVVRLGGPRVRKGRRNAANGHEDVFMYRDLSTAPLLDLRRRIKAAMDVLDAMIRNRISLARSVEPAAQWDEIFCAGRVVFALFPGPTKVRVSPRTRVRSWVGHVSSSTLSAHQMARPGVAAHPSSAATGVAYEVECVVDASVVMQRLVPGVVQTVLFPWKCRSCSLSTTFLLWRRGSLG